MSGPSKIAGPFKIEAELIKAHKSAAKAAGMLAIMIERAKVRPMMLQEANLQLESAKSCVAIILDNSK